MNRCTFALKLEILILFILDEHRVVKRGVHFLMSSLLIWIKEMDFYKFFKDFLHRSKQNTYLCPL